jgi:hypothetical protein
MDKEWLADQENWLVDHDMTPFYFLPLWSSSSFVSRTSSLFFNKDKWW